MVFQAAIKITSERAVKSQHGRTALHLGDDIGAIGALDKGKEDHAALLSLYFPSGPSVAHKPIPSSGVFLSDATRRYGEVI